ncbi:MAG TPA: hypothetical protein VFR31_13255 [Thermoanaerobaculia bacterium]|nr:hypothetical protein [Thermoanaerobaculia bacterium]
MRTRIAVVSLLFATLPHLAAAQAVPLLDLDRICGVRDCAEIGLFWHQDLEAAKRQALAEGKPILSLRLLGRLDEEFSCANSRYFRTVYYRNREISQLLRERFVLHWKSVRPVPKVTIDFGDGRRLERTLTGNSIHYVLDSRGRLVDALPGLSGPDAFKKALVEAERGARIAMMQSDGELAWWRAERYGRQLVVRARTIPEAPRNADRLAVSKSAGEGSILRALDEITDEQIRDIAESRRKDILLDEESRAFLLFKHGVTDPAEAKRLVDAFEATLAQDEVINEYRTGPAILRELSDPEKNKGLDLEAFNEWVYAEVFLAPLSDPWMGLAPEDVYVALPASTRTAQP